MKSRVILLFLACLFLFAQYVSIEQTISVISCAIDKDDIDDLSDEDIVPVDPFLAPSIGRPADLCNLIVIALTPLFIRLADVQPDDQLVFIRIQKENGGLPPDKIWLANCVLLI